jgi:hypothetical protein
VTGRFKTISAQVEAITVVDLLYLAASDWGSLPGWIRDAYDDDTLFMTHEYVGVRGMYEMEQACQGDWIVRSRYGVLRVYSSIEFAQTYEAA